MGWHEVDQRGVAELNDEDLMGIARRIADNARSRLEADDKVWIYIPSFRDAVVSEAFAMLQTVVLHERRARD